MAIPDTDARSYPGIVFRKVSDADYERFYIRPHRAPLYPDVLQYTPVFNGIAGWQLYSGDGFTAGATIPENQWFRVRMEIRGEQARVFIGDGKQPALVIPHLQHGRSKGAIGLLGPPDGTAYFSNFRFRQGEDLEFPPERKVETPPGVILNWELSPSFKASRIDEDRPLGEQDLPVADWTKIVADPTGLLDVARQIGRAGREPDCVLARAMILAGEAGVEKLRFGYSDAVVVYVNGSPVFQGNSAYRGRDPSFLGIVGLNDAVHLPLRAGKNDLVLAVCEAFGGWGFIVQHADAVYLHSDLEKAWEIPEPFRMPETVIHDAQRDALYVSNFDGYSQGLLGGKQTISKLATDGTVTKREWVTGLVNPTGLALAGRTLYAVERRSVAEIDVESGEIVKRHALPIARFPNDIAVDDSGVVYVSDSGTSSIYRLGPEGFETWLQGDDVAQPNGLHVHGGKLIVGTNADHELKAIDLATGEIEVVAALGPGIIDGIEADRNGNLLVSLYEGKLYRIAPSGEVTKLLDTTAVELPVANFSHVIGEGLLVIPTLEGNRVNAYRLKN
jgi:hypothetical protein